MASCQTSTNLTTITWDHAVNSQKLLTDCLASSVDMIEADIIFGKLNGAGNDIPIMGHPPANTSDLSFESFLSQIMTFNVIASKPKGVKLDFKSTEVFNVAVPVLEKLYKEV